MWKIILIEGEQYESKQSDKTLRFDSFLHVQQTEKFLEK